MNQIRKYLEDELKIELRVLYCDAVISQCTVSPLAKRCRKRNKGKEALGQLEKILSRDKIRKEQNE